MAGATTVASGMPAASTATERLRPELAPIHGTAARRLAAARRLGEAAIDRHVVQHQADHPVVGRQRQGVQRLHDPGRDPLVAPAPQGARRAGGVGDAGGGAAEDQHLPQLVEDDAIGNARAMAAERMGCLAGGQQGGDLVPDGLDDG